MASFLEDVNQMVIDAVYQDISYIGTDKGISDLSQTSNRSIPPGLQEYSTSRISKLGQIESAQYDLNWPDTSWELEKQ